MTTSVTQQIKPMRSGGKKLGAIRDSLKKFTRVGMTFEAIEAQAQKLLAEHQVLPSFSTVAGYNWATCIMRNEELCHGIPLHKKIEEGDVITIDIGLINQGYHLDTTVTFAVGQVSADTQLFIERGRAILNKAIAKARVGSSVYDVSAVMENSLRRFGYSAVHQLTGHGIGKELHMAPGIPCVARRSDKKVKFFEGQTVAIEVMYAQGKPDVVLASDGWTYRTADLSLTGMFEETVLIGKSGPEILTST